MTWTDKQQHLAVTEFFRRVREDDPERYAEVMEELEDYPVVTSQRQKTIRHRERSVGLLGVAPAFIAPSVATQFGLESVYEGEE